MNARSEVREAYTGMRSAHDIVSFQRDQIVPLRKQDLPVRLPENVTFHDELTGVQTLRFYADLKGVDRAQCVALLDRDAPGLQRVSDAIGGGTFTTAAISDHLSSNARLIEKFLPVEIHWVETGDGWRVTVAG